MYATPKVRLHASPARMHSKLSSEEEMLHLCNIAPLQKTLPSKNRRQKKLTKQIKKTRGTSRNSKEDPEIHNGWTCCCFGRRLSPGFRVARVLVTHESRSTTWSMDGSVRSLWRWTWAWRATNWATMTCKLSRLKATCFEAERWLRSYASIRWPLSPPEQCCRSRVQRMRDGVDSWDRLAE